MRIAKIFKNLYLAATILFGVIALSSLVLAQTSNSSAKTKKEEALPKSGVLSQTFSEGGNRSPIKADMPWGKAGIESDKPIEGSAFKVSDREVRMNLVNNSEDAYSASVRVIQMNANGTQVKSDSFSYKLNPKEKVTRTVAAAASVANVSLILNGWKNLSKVERERKQAEEETKKTSQASSKAPVPTPAARGTTRTVSKTVSKATR